MKVSELLSKMQNEEVLGLSSYKTVTEKLPILEVLSFNVKRTKNENNIPLATIRCKEGIFGVLVPENIVEMLPASSEVLKALKSVKLAIEPNTYTTKAGEERTSNSMLML